MKTSADHNPIRDNRFFKYASSKRYLKIFVPEFAFKHDNSFDGKDKFVGRDVQIRRLFMWLTSTSRSGSYLITGYRGMGKSVLVRRVLHNITREQVQWPEFVFKLSIICLFAACFFYSNKLYLGAASRLWSLFSILSVLLLVVVIINSIWPFVRKGLQNWHRKIKYNYDPEILKKTLFKDEDCEDQCYWRIPININLGQEVLNERDVLGLIAQNVRDKYVQFVNSAQIHPVLRYASKFVICVCACYLSRVLTSPVSKVLKSLCYTRFLEDMYETNVKGNEKGLYIVLMIVLAVCFYYLIFCAYKWFRRKLSFFSAPYQAIDRLDLLCERINATIQENNGIKGTDGDVTPHLNISFIREKRKIYPIANIREIEQELIGIINSINPTSNHFRYYHPQFIIVFDELDKISGSEFRTDNNSRQQNNEDFKSPEFDTSVEGFTGTMEYEERKKNILHLLSNMKMFISTVQAKCVFISGHELFDASLADLSDREFAISSVFNGVLNVDSFLSPEREQNDVSSMTELYLSNILLPKSFLEKKAFSNLKTNNISKKELPSLRWYYEYLTATMLETYKDADEEVIKEKEQEIQFAVLFLRYFAVFLAHLCNGSPKKISSTLETYIRTESDTNQLYDWGDVVTIGVRTEKNAQEQCVLWIDPTEQQYINFIHYIASPVMNSITNEVSHYGDKLLVASSFILDQIYKYHSKGFSWRNLEQMPELLNANKNPELRDSMASIMEFQLQTHITNVSSGIHQYKFHKQIAEEISYISMISEEASAIFNFTLNESSTVKRYNMRLFSYYQQLSRQHPKDKRYQTVIGMIHENLGDIYSMDEDYYYAIMEYNNALSSIQSTKLTTENIISYLKCSLKLGNAYEYRRTFENAYMIYTQVINRLIQFREIDERKLGLEYTYFWTKDWRQKQPIVVDYQAMHDQRVGLAQNDSPQTDVNQVGDGNSNELNNMRDLYNKHMNRYVWDKENSAASYNQDVGNLILGLSSDITPVKNEMIQTLEVFEDIDYIYQAIIAKFFLVEKMELGGISYSTLEVAEREFKYLHCTTNMERKYIIAADFFHKVASVLYYKNGYVTPPNYGKGLVEALYFFDCNVLDFVEDYCLYRANHRNGAGEFNSIKTKNSLENFFEKATLDSIKELAEMNSTNHSIPVSELWTNDVVDYFKFVKNVCPTMFQTIDSKCQEIKNCAERKKVMVRMGYKLPCNACRYAHRSLEVQFKHFFVDDILEKHHGERQIVSYLRLTSRKHIQHLRPSETSLLAHTLEQMGDILLSCSLTRTEEFNTQSKRVHDDFATYDWNAKGGWQDYASKEVIELLGSLSELMSMPEVERDKLIDQLEKLSFTKIDRVLIYYWCASRFYDMGSLYKEAAYCVERMLKVMQEYLQVLNSSESTESVMCESVDALCGFKHFNGSLKECEKGSFTLIHNLFSWVVRYVGRKFNNYGLGEIIENKWLYNLERMDEVDLMLLSEYSDLKSAFLTAMDVKLNCLSFEKRFNSSLLKRKVYQNWYREYLANVYERVSSPLIHDKTFKEEILGYYMKAVLNKHVLIDCFGKDVLSESRLSKQANKTGKADFDADYYEALSEFISKEGSPSRIDKLFYSASNPQERLQLVEFLIQDSIVCLSSILSILTPHNHYTSFSNSFMGDVYALLWEWAIYYESTYELYLYRRYDDQGDAITKKAIAEMVARNSTFDHVTIEKVMRKCLENVSNVSDNKTQGGYQYTRLFMNIRHDIDDATIHHIFTNYAAESAIKYYNLAKDINNEGVEYKNMIMGMYVLDDDLRNDTCQSNLADERFMLHCGLLERRRDLLFKIYGHSRIAWMGDYEDGPVDFEQDPKRRIKDRHIDSIYINSEY